MLLNRKRVKFWQKIVFGFMAALMASFLIFGYSGIASGCSHSSSLNSGNSGLDAQLKAALKQLAKDPQDPTALQSAAQAYSAAGTVSERRRALGPADDRPTKAIAYYERYIKLPDAKLGSTAPGLRVQALQAEAVLYSELIDYKSAVAVYQRALKITPSDSQPYLGIASPRSSQRQAGGDQGLQEFLSDRPELAVRLPGQDGSPSSRQRLGLAVAIVQRQLKAARTANGTRPTATRPSRTIVEDDDRLHSSSIVALRAPRPDRGVRRGRPLHGAALQRRPRGPHRDGGATNRVDLSRVTFIDSTALGVIISGRQAPRRTRRSPGARGRLAAGRAHPDGHRPRQDAHRVRHP